MRHKADKRKGSICQCPQLYPKTNPLKRTLTTQRGSRIHYVQRDERDSVKGQSDGMRDNVGPLGGQSIDGAAIVSADLLSNEISRDRGDRDSNNDRVDSTSTRVVILDGREETNSSDPEDGIPASRTLAVAEKSTDNHTIQRTLDSDDKQMMQQTNYPKDVYCDICLRYIPFLVGIGPIHHAIAVHGQPPEGLAALPDEPEFHYDRCQFCQLFFDKFAFRYHRCQSPESTFGRHDA